MEHQPLVEKIKVKMDELNIPGVAVGVVHGDETFTAGFGVTNIDHPLEVNDGTLFQIGSITKTFVGTMGMQLAEQGKLDLTAPIREYLPDFRVADEEASAKVTMRHLFTHTAGWIGDYFPESWYGDDALARYVASMTGHPQLTPVGKVLSYNNAGFWLAGRVFEVITGKKFEDLVKEMMFEPLGMNHSYMLSWDVMTYRFASGHINKNDEIEIGREWSIGRASPSGGIITCVQDMLNYIRLHLGNGLVNGIRLLSKGSLETMHTPQVQFTPHDSVAITIWADDTRAARTLGHGGTTFGQTSQFNIVPVHDFGIIIMTNASNGHLLDIDVVNFALEHYLGINTPKAELIDLSEDQLATYVGKYDAVLSSSELTMTDGTLSIVIRSKGGYPRKSVPPAVMASPPSKVGFYAKNHIIVLEGPFKDSRGQFLRDERGDIAWFRFGRRIQRPM